MASVTNKTLNTGSVTNKAYSPTDITWGAATFAWEDAGIRTWGDQGSVVVTNKAANSASITNKDLS